MHNLGLFLPSKYSWDSELWSWKSAGSCFSGFSVEGVVGGVSVAELSVEVVVAQHRFGVALSVKVFGERKRSGVVEDSGCQEGRAPALSEADYLEAAPAIWASARSELSGEVGKKTI
ncbi:MAG: hypothetical protein GY820_05815, partial [Gammaproteobacteria bacterium]|nr:hypothetical protein [Gammaproteobacteria bacterium]